MKLRIFNAIGLMEAEAVLDRLRSGELETVPQEFLESDEYSRELELQIQRPRSNEIGSRWQFAVWLWQKLGGIAEDQTILSDPGFWTWLDFFLIDTVAPVRGDKRKIGESARHISARGNYRKYYRHLVAGPYMMIRTHSDSPHLVRGLLSTKPDTPGEVYEQIASRPAIVNSAAAVGCASQMYFDSESLTYKRGSAGDGGGSARRYAMVLMQYDVTFDLFAIEQSKLLAMLPKEFARFITS
jgi:hypothetical protein